MSTHPYIPLFVDDYDAATSHLSVEEDGAYSRLLRLCWRTPGCSLPNDPAWIARKIRMTTEEFGRVARPVLDEFFTLSRGRLIQRRLKREYDDISRKKTARKKAGKSGGDAKAAKTKTKGPSNATVLPADTRAFPDPYPEPEVSNPPTPLPGGLAEALASYPEEGRNVSDADAEAAWRGATADHAPDALISAAKSFGRSRAATRAPRFDRWLTRRQFEAWLPGVASAAPPPDFAGPAAVRDAVLAGMGEARGLGHLALSRWVDLPIPTLITRTETTARAIRDEAGRFLAEAGGPRVLSETAFAEAERNAA